MITYFDKNIINKDKLEEVSNKLQSIICKLRGKCIANSRNYDKGLCELSEGVLTHVLATQTNRTYWDAIMYHEDGKEILAYIENKKCKGSMFFNIRRYCNNYLQIDEESKINTFTVIYKYVTLTDGNNGEVKEILIIETKNLIDRLLRSIHDKSKIANLREICNLFIKDGLDLHMQAGMKYKQMEDISSAKIVYTDTASEVDSNTDVVSEVGSNSDTESEVTSKLNKNDMSIYLADKQRLRLRYYGKTEYAIYDTKKIVYNNANYNSLSGFACAASQVINPNNNRKWNGWTSVEVEESNDKWIKVDKLRKK